MVSKILSVSLISAMLLFSGCGDSDEVAESRLDTQQMLDSGDFQDVITKLENGLFLTDADSFTLGAAYMGRAGLGISDLITILVDDSDSGSDSFTSFINDIGSRATDSALVDLNKADVRFKNIVGNVCEDKTALLTDTQESVCLYVGLAKIMKVATTFSYIGDVAAFSDTQSGDDEMKASECAMQYAFDGNAAKIDAVCNIIPPVVAATDVTFSTTARAYKELTITVNGNEYDYLMPNATPNLTTVTDGYCTNTNFLTRNDIKFTGSYACPVNESPFAPELTVLDVLVDSLNGGIDSTVNSTGGDDSDTGESVTEFKEEVKNGGSGDVTEQDIIDYLNRKNN